MLVPAYLVNTLVNVIIQQYFERQYRCLLIFTDTPNAGPTYHGTLPSVRISITVEADEAQNYPIFDNDLVFKYHGCQGVIIQSKNPQQIFINFEREIRLHNDRFNFRRFLIVPVNDSATIGDDFFQLEALNHVSDLLLLSPIINDSPDKGGILQETSDVIVELKTHKYAEQFPPYNRPIVVDKWFSENGTFAKGANLYPDKVTNQMGRGLRIATLYYEPYSIVKDGKFYGSELITALNYAYKHNMTPEVIVSWEELWGDVYPNWTGYGLLGNVLEDRAEIGFGSLGTWESFYYFFEMSTAVVRTGVTCLVPAPRLVPGWLTPLFSFTTQLWMWFLIFFACASITLCISLNKYEHYNQNVNEPRSVPSLLGASILQIWKPFIVQPLTDKELKTDLTSKFILVLVLLLSIFLTSCYSSGFASVMTIPKYEKAIDTVADFAKSGLGWGATQDTWIITIKGAGEPDYRKIVKTFIGAPEEDLHERSKSKNFGFAVERLPAGDYAIGSYIKKDVIEDYHLMLEDIYWERTVIMTRKNSVLLPSINDFILKLGEAGLISKWQNQAVAAFLDPDVQKAVKYARSVSGDNVVKLKWTHVQGAFAILTLGHSISTVVFIFETLKYRLAIK